MEIRSLRYFLTIAKEENITHAAEILHITQPTLSRQMMQLEEELNTQLFIRGKRKIMLTEAGKLLKRRAEEVVSLVDKTEKEFLSEANINGQILIGSGEFLSSNHFSQVLKEFHDIYPDVTYDLLSGNTDEIQYKLDNGLIDIALVMGQVDINKYDFLRLPEQDVWGLVMRKDDPLANKEYITTKDLIDIPLAISRRKSVQNEVENWAGADYKKFKFEATFDLMAANIVKNQLANAITIEIISNVHNELTFRPLKPALKTGTVLIWKKNQPVNPTVMKFLEFVVDHYKNKKS